MKQSLKKILYTLGILAWAATGSISAHADDHGAAENGEDTTAAASDSRPILPEGSVAARPVKQAAADAVGEDVVKALAGAGEQIERIQSAVQKFNEHAGQEGAEALRGARPQLQQLRAQIDDVSNGITDLEEKLGKLRPLTPHAQETFENMHTLLGRLASALPSEKKFKFMQGTAALRDTFFHAVNLGFRPGPLGNLVPMVLFPKNKQARLADGPVPRLDPMRTFVPQPTPPANPGRPAQASPGSVPRGPTTPDAWAKDHKTTPPASTKPATKDDSKPGALATVLPSTTITPAPDSSSPGAVLPPPVTDAPPARFADTISGPPAK